MGLNISRSTRLNRLEEFILESRKGKKIEVETQLRREKILGQAGQCAGQEGRIDGYLFIADFLCCMESQRYTVSKVYSLSYLTKDPTDLHVDRQVANARLKMDYQRLREAGIEVQEMYFPEHEDE